MGGIEEGKMVVQGREVDSGTARHRAKILVKLREARLNVPRPQLRQEGHGVSDIDRDSPFPRRISLMETFLTLKPTLSPGKPSGICSWCISTDLTSVVTLVGAKVTTIPALMTPVSTRPTGTVPIPPDG